MMNTLRTWLLRLLSLRARWLGVLIACVVWLIWMVTGFWAMLLLLVLAAVGYGIGAALEHGVTWRDVLEKLLTNRDSR